MNTQLLSRAKVNMHIDDLHVEIMGMIFHMHVYQHFGSRHSLLLTSRRWYTIATSHAALWTTISWGEDCQRSPGSVKCDTLDQLASAIRWTGQATFDLDIGGSRHRPSSEDITIFITFVGDKWLSRCRSLTISMLYDHADDLSMDLLERLLHHGTLDGLERLIWDCCGHRSRKKGMSMLMGRVQLSSLRLRALRLRYGHLDYHNQEFPSQYMGLLKRISSLTLSYFSQPVPWNEFEGLKHLDFARFPSDSPLGIRDYHTPCSSNLSDLVASRLTSLSLEGGFARNDFPSKDLFRQLKRLVLRQFTTAQNENIFPEKFPSLLYLGIGRCRYPYDVNLDSIVTSGIDELDISTSGDYFAPAMLAASLAPRVLRVDGIPGKLEDLGRYFPIWDRLEEMHLTVEGNDDLPPVLVDALSRPMVVESTTESKRYSGCFLRLKVFKMRYPTMVSRRNGVDPPSEEEMEKRTEVLRRVVKDRKRSGIPRLERIQVGWYWRGASGGVLGDHLTDWRVTSWTDCSEGEDMELDAD